MNNLDIIKVIELCGGILKLFKYIIPLVIIGYGTIDLYKGIIGNEESLKKGVIRLIYRIIAGILVFFMPTIVLTIFGLIGYKDNNYINCFLDTSSCKKYSDNITELNNETDDICTVEEEDCISYEIYIGGTVEK